MSRLNEPGNFAGRVSYAAFVITNKRNTTRAFDNCFENYDGDAVVAALVRRAEKNEKLRANLFSYLNEASAIGAYERLKGQKLAQAAREMRASAKAKAKGTQS